MNALQSFIPGWTERGITAPYRKQYVATIGLGLALQVSSALLMFFAGYLICQTAEDGTFLMMVMTPLACVQLFGLARPLSRYFERLFSHDWVFRITSELRRRLFHTFSHEDSAAVSTPTGDYVATLSEDIGHFQNLYLRVVLPTVIALLMWLLVIVFFGLFSPLFCITLVLVSGCAVVVVPFVSYRLLRVHLKEIKSDVDDVYVHLADDVYGAAEWRRALRTSERKQLALKEYEMLQSGQAKARLAKRTATLLMKLFLLVAVVSIIVWSSDSFSPIAAQENARMIAAFSLGWFPLFEAFLPLVDAAFDLPGLEESASNLSNRANIHETIDFNEATGDHVSHANNGFTVVLNSVSFAYPGTDVDAIKDVTLAIAEGSKVAILGRSGSGKSTLAGIIRGELRPQTGSTLIGGDDVSSSEGAIHERCGIVGQNAYLFDRSLRDNLLLARPDASDEELFDALSKAGMGAVLDSLHDGLDTMIGESGERFSGGERQRIALARILLSNPDIVILDEVTNGLDPATETKVMATVLQALEGKTVIYITHHLLGIDCFDRVIMLEDGHVILDGSPSQLVAESARFKKLYEFDR